VYTHTHTELIVVCELLFQGKVGNSQHSKAPVINPLCQERALALSIVLERVERGVGLSVLRS
jgi:hypothetical protein